MSGKKKEIRGRIILVQENRFRMVDEAGRGYLFSLAHSTVTSPEDLQRWHLSDVPVRVTYQGEPNLASGIARAVEPVERK